MAESDKTRSNKFLRPNHKDFKIAGKPALVLNHMQRGLAGEGMFIPNWGPNAAKGIADSGMVEKCRILADAFRAKDLPVIFVNAIPNPIGKVPAYGDLYREIEAANIARHYFTDEYIRRGLEVMPEMGYVEGKDEVLYNWLIHSFTNSGLDVVLKKHKCDTIVWGGFAQNSVVYTSSLVAGDLWYNGIIPVDASYICVPPQTPGYYEGIDDVVAEAVVRVMAPTVNQVTDTATVLEKLEYLER